MHRRSSRRPTPVSVGSAIRHVLGARLARRVGHLYRAFFVDLRKVAAAVSTAVPANALVLDVGGGDGEPLNYLLGLRADIRVTTIDLAPDVGHWIDVEYADRVLRMPRCSIDDYLASDAPIPDVLLLSDVMHHIPPTARASFLASVATLVARAPGIKIIIKDVEPGHIKSLLGYWSDKYVTGDKGVSLIGRDALKLLLQNALSPLRSAETSLFAIDKPNYALIFFR